MATPQNLVTSTVNAAKDDKPDGSMLLIIIIALSGVIALATIAIVSTIIYRKCKSRSRNSKDEPNQQNVYSELSPVQARQYAALQSPPGSTLPRIYENVRPQSAPQEGVYDTVKTKTNPKPHPVPPGYANLPVATPSSSS